MPIPNSSPLGQGNYLVQQGDCMHSIAALHGFHWATLWNLAENAELREGRRDPSALLPGDRVTIPALCQKQVEAQGDARHRFVKRGSLAWLVMRIFEDGEPRAKERYVLIVDGIAHSGELDEKGGLCESIGPHARSGQLIIDADEAILLQFGALDSATELSGVQSRLRNLGFSPDGLGLEIAIRNFQRAHRVKITGEVDATTREVLLRVHGS
jgi:hypothetical protein